MLISKKNWQVVDNPLNVDSRSEILDEKDDKIIDQFKGQVAIG